MALDDLRRRIFRKEEKFPERFGEPHLSKHAGDAQSFWTPEQSSEEKLKERTIMKKILRWGIGAGFLIAVLFVGIFFFVFRGGGIGSNTLSKLDVRVEGGEEISSGAKTIWRVKYRNTNSIALENASLTFQFPDTAQPLVGEFSKAGLRRERRDIGTIAPGAEGEAIFSALVFGSRDQVLPGKVYLEYRPQDSSARLSKDASYSSTVVSMLLGVDLDVPQELQEGQDAEVIMRVVSNAETVFRGLSLIAEYPPAFEFVSAEPAPERANTIWRIGDLAGGQEFIVKIRGKVKKETATQTFRATVGLYNRIENTLTAFNSSTKTFTVAEPLLSVVLETKGGEIAPGIAAAGAHVTTEVHWKNNLPVAVRNASVELMFEGQALDLRTLTSEKGDFDATRNSIRWIGGRVPELSVVEPGAEGSYSVSYTIVREIPVEGPSDKNFSVHLKAEIRANETPQGFEGIDITGRAEREIKIVTKPGLSHKGYYFDTDIPNTGPFPPRVGQETTFVVVWSLVNNLNDLDRVSVRATLPSYIRWAGVVAPSGATLIFDPATRELVWSPGTVAAGTGFIRQAQSIEFQIGLTPSVPQIGGRPELVSEAVLRAHDTFTDQDFTMTEQPVTTDIRFDPKAARLDRQVHE